MKMRWMWTLSWLVGMSGVGSATPSHTGPSGTGFPVSRPRAPQSLESPSRAFPALAVVDFISVVGGVPASSLSSVTPQDDSEKAPWEARVSQWRADQKQLLEKLRALVPSQKARLTPDTSGGLLALKGQVEGWQARSTAGNWGNQIFSEEALALAQESASLLVAYAEAYADLDQDPGRGKPERERLAFERAMKAQPETASAQVEPKRLDRLSPYHKTQVQRLVTLRDSLRLPGNLETFAASLRRDTQPARRIENFAKR
jgi:hypothetical protein